MAKRGWVWKREGGWLGKMKSGSGRGGLAGAIKKRESVGREGGGRFRNGEGGRSGREEGEGKRGGEGRRRGGGK